MPALLRHLCRVLTLTVLLLSAGCKEAPTSELLSVSVNLIIVSGDGQSGAVGQELPLPLIARALNPNGTPAANVPVDFKVTGGNGSMFLVSSLTNSQGYTANYWTLGTSTVVAQTVEVRTILSNKAKAVLGIFHATPLAGPARLIVPQAGDGQTAPAGTQVPVSPAVRVTDVYGNPVPNLLVTFAVASGGGSVTGASPLTNSSGIATVGSWTLGQARQNTLTATAAGSGISGNPVTFTATATLWSGKTPMPTARYGLGVGVINGVLYAVGGSNSSFTPLGTVEAFDPATNSWTTKSPMPTPRTGLGVAVINGVLYAVGGGSNSGRVGTVEAYDPVTNSWSTKAPMPTAREDLSVGVVNGVLYAVGGVKLANELDIVEAYDPATNSWTTKSPMPTPGRKKLGVGVVNGVLYAVGGYSQGNTLGTVQAYDPATNSWTTKASMPTPRMGLGVGVVNGSLYAVGGLYPAGSSVEAYDPATNSWTTGDSLPTPRGQLGVGVVNGVLYAVGGTLLIGANALGTVEAFIP